MKESMNIRWVAETGIVEAIEPIIKEYKETRGLLVSFMTLFMYFFNSHFNKICALFEG